MAFSFEIIKNIGLLSKKDNGWKKEVNIVSWSGKTPKIDIREWDEHHEKMSKGISLTEEELKKLYEIAKKYLLID